MAHCSASDAPRLERVIGTGALASSCLNCIVGTGIFGLPGLVAAALGPAALLAYLVCVVMIGLVGLCFAEIGSRVDRGGGLYGWAMVSLGPIVGGMVGTLMWAANSVAAGAAVANLLMDTLARFVPGLSAGPLRAAALFTIYGVLAAVNVRGARAGARLSMTLAVIKIAPLVVLAIAGMFSVSAANLRWQEWPSLADVGRTAVLLTFAFMGVEGGLNSSGEVKNPSRAIPRAIATALMLAASLYIALQAAAQGVLGPALAGEPAPLMATASAVFGEWGAGLLVVTLALSVAGYLSADMLCSPRIFHAMAEHGQLPQWLSSVHPRLKTPATAIGLYALLCATIASTGSFSQLALASASGTLIAYIICCIGLVPLRRRNVGARRGLFVAPGGALLPVATTAIIVWMLSTLSGAEIGAAALLAAGSGTFYALQAVWTRRASAIAVARGTSTL